MTREKWAAMTDDERRIKIAELCGWWLYTTTVSGQRWYRNKFGVSVFEGALPNYLNDLNAMAEAETILTMAKRFKYRGLLIKAQADKTYPDIHSISASAVQRAEAFVLTMEPE